MRRPTITLRGIPAKPVIYLAGKISRDDWREEILGDRPGGVYDNFGDTLWNPLYRLPYEAFHYGGPFFVSCDHGCGHRGNAHGANGGLTCSTCGDDDVTELHQKVWDVNCARVQMADLIFAYVNEADSFGTMVEIGVAAASSKAIFLALGPSLSAARRADLWMLQMPAIKVYGGGPGAAWRSLCRDLGLGAPSLALVTDRGLVK